MSDTTIEWAEKSWNPVTGCTPVSEGCANCYAKRMANRLRGRFGYPADDPFRVTLHPDRLTEPLRWRKPRRVFVCSMGDLFHDDVPTDLIDNVLEIVAACPAHQFLLVTKRPENIDDKLYGVTEANACRSLGGGDYLPNLWLGVSVENQARADERIPILLQIPAAVRFVSYEPALGPVDFSPWLTPAGELVTTSRTPDWLIAGGESGPGARPAHPDWFRKVRDDCQAAGAAFFFKQWGAFRPYKFGDPWTILKPVALRGGGARLPDLPPCDTEAEWRAHLGDTALMEPVGKKAAGRLLDGREWNEYPAEAEE